MDTLIAYSKRHDLLSDLGKVTDQLARALRDDVSGQRQSVRSTGRVGGPARLEDRLGADELHQLVTAFLSGAPKWKLAEQYGISESGVKDVLRRQGIRKKHRYDHDQSA